MKIQDIPTYHEFYKLLQMICKSSVELLHASASSIYLKEGDEVVMHAAYGYSESLIHTARYNVGEGITGWIAEGNELIANSKKEIAKHKYHLGKYDREIWKNGDTDCYSFIGVPLYIGNDIYGLIKVENKVENGICCSFTNEDLERLKIFLFALSNALQHNKEIMSALGKFFVFVLMPFDDKFSNIYDCIIQAAEKADMICARCDEKPTIGRISTKIYESINKADIIVSLMTEKNPNVFYETGYAHAINKPTIHLAEDAREIPFDLRDYGHVIYDPNKKLKELREDLIRYFEFVRQNILHNPYETDRITRHSSGPSAARRYL